MASKPVVIKILRRTESIAGEQMTRRLDGNEPELDDDVELGELLGTQNMFFGSDAPVIFETKGVITEENGEVSIVYETRLEEPIPAIVTYSFKKAQRNVLAVRKSSLGENVFFYETKRKSQWLDEISRVVDEGSICFTKSLKNYITYDEGGYIELEYYIEINGELFEYNKEYFIVETIKEGKR